MKERSNNRKRRLPDEDDSEISFSRKKRSKSDASSISAHTTDKHVTDAEITDANNNIAATDSTSTAQNVRVVTRLRPLSTKEKSEQSGETLKAFSESSTIVVDKNRKFEFDAVFGPNTTQCEIYEKAVGDMVTSNIFKGFNVTILAYGQTGAGKTFTMGTQGYESTSNEKNADALEGGQAVLQPPSSGDGIIPRAVYDLFQSREEVKGGKDRVKVEMSYLEIYNEEARDLLCYDDSPSLLHIRDGKDGVHVQNLTWMEVRSPTEIGDLMASASERRATASTQMNAVSSRSHAICTLNVIIAPLEVGSVNDDANEECEEIRAKLTLVDLAGSERIKRTGAEGSRMKEGININKGLFVLGQVVSALSEVGQQQGQTSGSTSHLHVPYRDSKLTRLLQDSLGGNSRTIMVACVSPADTNVEESINTLRYAQRARNIKNSAVRNVVAGALSPVEAAALRRENQMLQLKVLQMEAQLKSQPIVSKNQICHYGDTTETLYSGERQIDPDMPLNVEKLEVVKMLRTKCAWLQSKIEQAEEQSRSLTEDALTSSLKADRWQLRAEELESLAKEKGFYISNEMPSDGKSATIIEELRREISDLNTQLKESLCDAAVSRATAAAVIAGDGDLSTVEEIALVREDIQSDGDVEDTNKSNNEKLSSELVSISDALEKKEAMVKQINKERECMESMRSHFEKALSSLQEEVDVLTSERETLLEKIERSSGSKPDPKIQARIEGLECRIKDLTAKTAEHKKTLRLRELAEKKCTKLSIEIQEGKKRRAAVQRKLKAEIDERRTEKKAAQKEATRMLRDSNKLKHELQKVKDAAARQAAVLRRKAAEAVSKQKQLAEQQKKRNNASSMKLMAKNSSRNRGTSSGLDQKREELVAWLERELESSITLQHTKQQIEEQKALLEEASEKRETLHDNDALGSSMTRALDSEIEGRTTIIKQLENNVNELGKSFDNGAATLTTVSNPFQDATTWSALSRTELKFAFATAFQRLVDIKVEMASLREDEKGTITKAINKAVADEKKVSEELIMKMKMEHCETTMTLLDSTRGAMELEVQAKLNHSKKSNDDGLSSPLKAKVDEMLKTYLDGCNKVGDTLKKELEDVKNHQDGMMKTIDAVAKGIIADTEASATKKKKKKKVAKKSEVLDDSVMFDVVFDEDEDVPAGDSDDSDWSPDTPKTKTRKFDKSNEKDSKTMGSPKQNISNEQTQGQSSEPTDNKVEEETQGTIALDSLKVVELRKMLRQRGLTIGGKKIELVNRLREDMINATVEFSTKQAEEKGEIEVIVEASTRVENEKAEDKSGVEAVAQVSAIVDDTQNSDDKVRTSRAPPRENPAPDSETKSKRIPKSMTHSDLSLSHVGKENQSVNGNVALTVDRQALKEKSSTTNSIRNTRALLRTRNKVSSNIPASSMGTRKRPLMDLSITEVDEANNPLLNSIDKKKRRTEMSLALNSAFSEFEKLKNISENRGEKHRSRRFRS